MLSDSLIFVDHEDSGFSYAAYDMAYFFCCQVGAYFTGIL